MADAPKQVIPYSAAEDIWNSNVDGPRYTSFRYLDTPIKNQFIDSISYVYDMWEKERASTDRPYKEDLEKELLGRGWDAASDWVGNHHDTWVGQSLKKNNPYTPETPIPTKKDTVIVPADGHRYIQSVPDNNEEDYNYHRVLVFDGTLWYGDGTEGVRSENIMMHTWKEYTTPQGS